MTDNFYIRYIATKSIKMKKILLYPFCFLFLLSCNKENNLDNYRGLIINEFLASNDYCCADSFGDFDDWVELYNDSEESIDIGGMFFTDTPGDDKLYKIPDDDPVTTTILPKGFLILWCDDDQEQGALHLSKKLRGSGESVILIEKDGLTVIDSITYPTQITDQSMGRNIENLDEWIFYEVPTPGAANYIN